VFREREPYRDLVSRLDSLTDFEQWSLVAHRSGQGQGFFAMMAVAYCDESVDTRIVAVSGLLGMLPDWVELERRWRHELAHCGLLEFHAAKVEQRRAPFEAYDRHQRDEFQRRLYRLIAGARLWGFCTAIWVQPFNQRREALENVLERSGMEL
jgi:hypothetical protein